jgi:hypothetical protein
MGIFRLRSTFFYVFYLSDDPQLFLIQYSGINTAVAHSRNTAENAILNNDGMLYQQTVRNPSP